MKQYLGIELGSTRIKAQLIDEQGRPLASGGYGWENQLVDGLWTYPLEQVWEGLQTAYRALTKDYAERQGKELEQIDAMGFSAMMHGYLVFDKEGKQLVPFRTWRNTNTQEARDALTKRFNFNIPHRWSIAHLYQAILNGEDHVRDIASMHTLSSYVHWKLTGKEVIGVGDASGMFPIDSATGTYDAKMIEQFAELSEDFPWSLEEILPTVLQAGDDAGHLTAEGARLLDPSGKLQAGIPLCPPEGDAGTGMVATNSVLPKTGNVSAGTSIFGMFVLEHDLKHVYPEIDLVTTPDSKAVAMVHCNNCTNEIDAWVKLLVEACKALELDIPKYKIYDIFYEAADSLINTNEAPAVMSYNFLAAEPVAKVDPSVPLVLREPGKAFGLAEFARSQVDSAVATLALGMDLLVREEDVKIESLVGHGGFFKTPEVGQRTLSAATGVPVSVMETAGEGGAWGMAILAAFLIDGNKETLPEYLNQHIFNDAESMTLEAEEEDKKRYRTFLESYKKGLKTAREAGVWSRSNL